MTEPTMHEISLSLSLLAKEKREVQERLSGLNAEEVTLRDQAQALMQEQGYKTFEGHGLQLMRSNRKSITVTDSDRLRDAIRDAGEFDNYLKFDETAAKKDAVKLGWPGVEEVVTDVLSIREARS